MTDEYSTLNVVAIGASAGGVEALDRLAAGLSPDLPYAVLVVLHMPADAPSVLAQIIDRHGRITSRAQNLVPAVRSHVFRLRSRAQSGGEGNRHTLIVLRFFPPGNCARD